MILRQKRVYFRGWCRISQKAPQEEQQAAIFRAENENQKSGKNYKEKSHM